MGENNWSKCENRHLLFSLGVNFHIAMMISTIISIPLGVGQRDVVRVTYLGPTEGQTLNDQ